MNNEYFKHDAESRAKAPAATNLLFKKASFFTQLQKHCTPEKGEQISVSPDEPLSDDTITTLLDSNAVDLRILVQSIVHIHNNLYATHVNDDFFSDKISAQHSKTQITYTKSIHHGFASMKHKPNTPYPFSSSYTDGTQKLLARFKNCLLYTSPSPRDA